MDWIVCPTCQLKHRKREDEKCPRCGNLVGAGAPPLPDTPAPPPDEVAVPVAPIAADSEPLSTAARIGGAVLLAAGALVLFERVRYPGLFTEGIMSTLWFASVVDVLLGVALIAGVRKLLSLVIVRILLGVLVVCGMWFTRGNWINFVAQAAFSAGLLLLLLAGDRRRRLVSVGLCLAGLNFAIELSGVYSLESGNFPLAAALSFDSEPVTGGEVHGVKDAYTVTLSASGWRVRAASAAAKDNPAADRWLVMPYHDTHILVIAERLPPGGEIDLAAAKAGFEKNLKEKDPTVEFEAWEPTHAQGGDGVIGRASGTVKGHAIQFRLFVLPAPGRVYTLFGLAPTPAMPKVEEELLSIFSTFAPSSP